jgi:ATP phosphoribosyltransferase regulatory subunit
VIPRTAIPKGVRVFTPEETAQRRAIEAKLLSVFHHWGFREIVTPTFEYLEVFEQPTGEDAGDQIFKFVDRQTGRLLALRVDITSQVARLVASTMRQFPLPLRLAYAATVFRYHEPRAGRQREFQQIGVELIGLDLPEADAEMIAMAVEGCRAVGLPAFQIDVGQVEVVRGLLNALQPPAELRRRLISAIRRKDALELDLLLAEVSADAGLLEAVRALPKLYGRREILDEAVRLAFPPASQAACQASSASSTGRPKGTGTPAARSSFLVNSLSWAMASAMALERSVSAAWMRRCRLPQPNCTRLPDVRRR